MKTLRSFLFFLAALALPLCARGQWFTLDLDTQTPENQYVIPDVFEGNTPFIQVRLYENGVGPNLSPYWSMIFWYSKDASSTSGVSIPGSWSDTNIVQFKGETNVFYQEGHYYFSVRGIHSSGYVKTFGRGTMQQSYDPAANTNLQGLISAINVTWWTNNLGAQVTSNQIAISNLETSKVSQGQWESGSNTFHSVDTNLQDQISVHTNLTGTNVHGLGSASTNRTEDFDPAGTATNQIAGLTNSVDYTNMQALALSALQAGSTSGIVKGLILIGTNAASPSTTTGTTGIITGYIPTNPASSTGDLSATNTPTGAGQILYSSDNTKTNLRFGAAYTNNANLRATNSPASNQILYASDTTLTNLYFATAPAGYTNVTQMGAAGEIDTVKILRPDGLGGVTWGDNVGTTGPQGPIGTNAIPQIETNTWSFGGSSQPTNSPILWSPTFTRSAVISMIEGKTTEGTVYAALLKQHVTSNFLSYTILTNDFASSSYSSQIVNYAIAAGESVALWPTNMAGVTNWWRSISGISTGIYGVVEGTYTNFSNTTNSAGVLTFPAIGCVGIGTNIPATVDTNLAVNIATNLAVQLATNLVLEITTNADHALAVAIDNCEDGLKDLTNGVIGLTNLVNAHISNQSNSVSTLALTLRGSRYETNFVVSGGQYCNGTYSNVYSALLGFPIWTRFVSGDDTHIYKIDNIWTMAGTTNGIGPLYTNGNAALPSTTDWGPGIYPPAPTLAFEYVWVESDENTETITAGKIAQITNTMEATSNLLYQVQQGTNNLLAKDGDGSGLTGITASNTNVLDGTLIVTNTGGAGQVAYFSEGDSTGVQTGRWGALPTSGIDLNATNYYRLSDNQTGRVWCTSIIVQDPTSLVTRAYFEPVPFTLIVTQAIVHYDGASTAVVSVVSRYQTNAPKNFTYVKQDLSASSVLDPVINTAFDFPVISNDCLWGIVCTNMNGYDWTKAIEVILRGREEP